MFLFTPLKYFFISYFLVTLIAILHTGFNLFFYKLSPKKIDNIWTAFNKTKPFHFLYNLFIFTICIYFYIQIEGLDFSFVIFLAFFFTFISGVADIFIWIVIKHPFTFTFKELYIDYQPWISLCYGAIFISFFIAFFLAL